jgi:hypothetical protein
MPDEQKQLSTMDLYVPPLAAVFGLAPLGPWHWWLLAAFGPLLLVLEEARKAITRRTKTSLSGSRDSVIGKLTGPENLLDHKVK